MRNEVCVSCKEMAYTEIRKVFYCINCFKKTVHRKIKRNIHLCSFPKKINLLFDHKKEDYVLKHAINEIYFVNNLRNQREFFFVSNESDNFHFLNECIKNREEDFSQPTESCLFSEPIEKICFDSLNFIVKNEPQNLKKTVKNKFIFRNIEFVNALTNVSKKEIIDYFEIIKEEIKFEENKSEIKGDKLEILLNEFLEELEEKNCGVSYNFLELLKKLEK